MRFRQPGLKLLLALENLTDVKATVLEKEIKAHHLDLIKLKGILRKYSKRKKVLKSCMDEMYIFLNSGM